MNKNKNLEWTRVGILLLIALLSTPFFGIFVTHVNAQETEVKVEPPTQEIGEDGVLLPTPPCTVNISVTNVVDLFTWQIRLYFNSAILRYDEAWLQEGHVFDDKMNIPVTPVEGSDENGTYIDYGCSLILIDDAFAGSGILCQINFTGIAEGSSALSFSETGPGKATFLLNSWSQDMNFYVTPGNITVKGTSVAKEDSEITLALSSPPERGFAVGDDVTISGAITPVQGIVNVTIKYKKVGEVVWGILANVVTDSESQYTYNWITTEKGTYDIKAGWPGDADTWPDESAPKSLDIWEGSEITLVLSPSEGVAVGDDVTISGAITPVQGIVNVTIKYKKVGEVVWGILANVVTDSESQYTYNWITTEKGTYDIKAGWPGDADTQSNESAPKSLAIGVEEAIDTVTYVIVGVVAVVVILAIVIYFVKFRKPE